MKDTIFESRSEQSAPESSAAVVSARKQIEELRRRREQQGYGVMVIAAGLLGGYPDPNRQSRLVNWARNFCIIFAFVVPNLLLIRVVF